MCAYCLDGKLEHWQDSRRRQGPQSALFWRCSNEDCDGKRTDFPSSDKNGRFYTINRQSVLAGRLCGNGHNALQKFSAAMDLPPPVTPKSFKKHEVSFPYIFFIRENQCRENLIKPYMSVSSHILQLFCKFIPTSGVIYIVSVS